MVKHTKSKRRNQKGGLFGFGSSSSDPTKKSWGQWLSGASNSVSQGTSNLVSGSENWLGSASNSISNASKNAWNNTGSFFSKDINLTSSSPTSSSTYYSKPTSTSTSSSTPYTSSNSTVEPIYSSPPVEPISNPDTNPSTEPVVAKVGGKKNRHVKNKTKPNTKAKSRKMRGGKPLGLTYYATPVHGVKVAEPTYWEVYGNGHIMKAGGSKRQLKKTRRQRKQ